VILAIIKAARTWIWLDRQKAECLVTIEAATKVQYALVTQWGDALAATIAEIKQAAEEKA
jgi:ethanolamine utilization protein EutA (predicted chaperonin)